MAAMAITSVLTRFEFRSFEAALYDLQTTAGLPAKPNPEIILLSVDDSTLKDQSELSPLPVTQHTLLLDRLTSARPKAVGFLVNLARSASLEPESSRPTALRKFVESASRLQAAGTPVVLGTPYDVTGELLPPYPISTLPHGLAVIHKDGAEFSGDKVSRRALLSLEGQPSFPVVLAETAGLRLPAKPVRASFEVPEIRARYFHFRYHGDPATGYRRIPVQSVLSGAIKPEELSGRIVLVGTALHEEPSDFVMTPFSRDAWASPRLALHAAILDSVLSDDGLYRSSGSGERALRVLLSLIASLLTVGLVMSTSPLSGLIGTGMVAAGFVVISYALFQIAPGVWLPMAHPLLAIFTAYYLAVPYRLLKEHRQRSHLQRKTEILMKVEELKTNFLSLVTHDLKTPVARIQGLAEVLLRKAAERLVERDRETLTHIIESTDELNRFISSILELAKIESAELKPRLESKDLNLMVERAVESFKAPARARFSTLECDLEPLFPIRMDGSLIQKVLHNLIDNALKYSPEGSTIHIQTRDLGEFVECSVQDQGIGLSEEEQENLFQKFYRAKRSATSHVAGSGLGLYLCRYFVEAHSGAISVSSTPGKGSTFTIRLPVSPAQASRPSVPTPGLRRGLATRILKSKNVQPGDSS